MYSVDSKIESLCYLLLIISKLGCLCYYLSFRSSRTYRKRFSPYPILNTYLEREKGK